METNQSRRGAHRLGGPAAVLLFLLGGVTPYVHAVEALPPIDARRPPGVGLGLSLGNASFAGEDLRETYGSAAVLSLRMVSDLDAKAQFFCGIGYSANSGNPAGRDPGFQSLERSVLTLMPIDAGLRLNLREAPGWRLYLGVAWEWIWARETLRGAYAEDPSARRNWTGWGPGARLLFGPEWMFASERFTFGLEFSAASRRVELRSGRYRRQNQLSEGSATLYLTKKL